jgi:ribosome maturation factor RimP
MCVAVRWDSPRDNGSYHVAEEPSVSATQTRALTALVTPIVDQCGAQFEAVTIRNAGKRRLVRIVVDEVGGLSLDRVAEISRAVSRALDDSDVLGNSPYVLEVSSPGVGRPLTLPRHWAAALGRLVEVQFRDGRVVTGRITASAEESAVLELDGTSVEVSYADVARAAVQVEFSRIAEVELEEGIEEDADEDPYEDLEVDPAAQSEEGAQADDGAEPDPGLADGPDASPDAVGPDTGPRRAKTRKPRKGRTAPVEE